MPTPPPAVRAKGVPRPRQWSSRTLAIAGVVLALVIAGIVAAIVLSGGNGNSSSTATLPLHGSLVNALPEAAAVRAEFKGIHQSGLFLGAADAPVHMIEYIDMQCPYCQQFETQVMPNLVAKYVRTGKVEVEARPLAFIGPDSIRGRNGMFAASFQNHAYDFAQLLYDNQGTENTGWLDDAIVAKAATSIPGVNPRLLIQVSTSNTMVAIGNRIDQEAKIDNVKGTPTILVGKVGTTPKQVLTKSPTDQASVVAAIEAALKR